MVLLMLVQLAKRNETVKRVKKERIMKFEVENTSSNKSSNAEKAIPLKAKFSTAFLTRIFAPPHTLCWAKTR